MQLNNLNLDVLTGVLERGRADAAAFAVHKRVEGSLNFTAGQPMFRSQLVHGGQTSTIAIDVAPGFGGQGLAPDPLQFLLAALGACYASTLATIAAMEGVALRRVDVSSALDANVAAVYDMGDGPLVEQIDVQVAVDADVDDATLIRWQDTAHSKCPFVFTVAHPITLTTRVTRA